MLLTRIYLIGTCYVIYGVITKFMFDPSLERITIGFTTTLLILMLSAAILETRDVERVSELKIMIWCFITMLCVASVNLTIIF